TPGNGFLASGPSMNLTVGDPTDNPIAYAITTNAFQANPDSYTAGSGTTLNINAANGILANDTGGPLTIVSPSTATVPKTSLPAGYVAQTNTQTPLSYIPPLTATTAQGGTVVLNSDGSFSYTPKAGFTGSDSFNYTVTDAIQYYKTDLPVLGTFN